MAESNDPSLTPEKRLLELIEEPDSHKREVTVATKKKDLKDLLSPAAFQEKFAALKGQGEVLFKKYKGSFGIREVNRILKAIVALMVLFFAVSFVVDLAGVNQDFSKSIQVPDSKMFEIETPKDVPAEGSAVEKWDLGKMFMPYGKRQEEAEKLQKEQSSRLADMTKKLKLTGISFNPSDPKSAFCMIEDLEKSITTVLREGDPVGLLKVQKIYEDRVVLEQGNETIEIR
ncbi:MAG: hypothetical protein PHV97_01875 [Candidatus Omnitrophica bacterium]|jgi:hypothetical protein|nr:hypothetical protein [Candidatus Omnitrophota bacterium]